MSILLSNPGGTRPHPTRGSVTVRAAPRFRVADFHGRAVCQLGYRKPRCVSVGGPQADPPLIDMFEKSLRNTPVISHTVNNEATNLAQVVRVFIAHLLAADSAPAS